MEPKRRVRSLKQRQADLPLRRRILGLGTLGGLGLGLPDLLWADAVRKSEVPAADACILIFLDGGPSHLDMWDMKPEAPPEIRGEFKPIASSLPGVQLSEHLPRLAKLMHHCSLIRSAHHSVNNAHAAAVYTSLTGHDRGESGGVLGTGNTDYPSIGSVLSLQRPPNRPVVPFVHLPYITAEGRGGPPQSGFWGGILGKALDPLVILKDPNSPSFAVPELTLAGDVSSNRLSDRRSLLASVDRSQRVAPIPKIETAEAIRQRAFDLMSSPASQRAFRLHEEPDAVRDSYGRNIYGQSVLTARRLIEAGARMVTISWAPDANATWDTHGGNFQSLKSTHLPQLDACLSSLLKDLVDRRMLERTLVLVMGEFGRSPKINANAGRDHWNFCYSLLMAGGGINPGVVHGASDRIGGRPKSDPVTPADVVATVYHCLGIPTDLELVDRLARPFPLVPWGDPIRSLIA